MTGVATTADELIKRFELEPLLPEGGFFRRTHYSSMPVTTPHGERRAKSAIMYLMQSENCSKIHRLKMDETWHFYHGSPMVLVELDADAPGHCRLTRLGSVIDGLCPQHTVSAGTWFGAYPDGDFALVGCTCGNAFEVEDFELATKPAMLEQFPEAEAEIKRLTDA